MTLAITSIQRDRAPWLMEWLAFRLLVGFDRFFLYLRKCGDGSVELAQRHSRHYPISLYAFDTTYRPQLFAYQHAWNSYGAQVDWMALTGRPEAAVARDARPTGRRLNSHWFASVIGY